MIKFDGFRYKLLCLNKYWVNFQKFNAIQTLPNYYVISGQPSGIETSGNRFKSIKIWCTSEHVTRVPLSDSNVQTKTRARKMESSARLSSPLPLTHAKSLEFPIWSPAEIRQAIFGHRTSCAAHAKRFELILKWKYLFIFFLSRSLGFSFIYFFF